MSHPICARCQLPTASLWADGRCVECRKAMGLPVAGMAAFDAAPVGMMLPVFDPADVQAALCSDVQPLFSSRTYTSMDVLE